MYSLSIKKLKYKNKCLLIRWCTYHHSVIRIVRCESVSPTSRFSRSHITVSKSKLTSPSVLICRDFGNIPPRQNLLFVGILPIKPSQLTHLVTAMYGRISTCIRGRMTDLYHPQVQLCAKTIVVWRWIFISNLFSYAENGWNIQNFMFIMVHCWFSGYYLLMWYLQQYEMRSSLKSLNILYYTAQIP